MECSISIVLFLFNNILWTFSHIEYSKKRLKEIHISEYATCLKSLLSHYKMFFAPKFGKYRKQKKEEKISDNSITQKISLFFQSVFLCILTIFIICFLSFCLRVWNTYFSVLLKLIMLNISTKIYSWYVL